MAMESQLQSNSPSKSPSKSMAPVMALALTLALFGWSNSGWPAPLIKQQTIPLEQLVALLQQGGLVMLMRHAATDHSQKDLDRDDFSDCSRQRDLSELGQADMAIMAKALEKLAIPIGEIFSSPYCRARKTAEIAFGRYELDDKLQFSISKNRQEAQQLADHLLTRIMTANTADQQNAVIITHTSNIRDATGIWPSLEGVTLVFKQSQEELIFLGEIPPGYWAEL